jgi:hypothetical protein
MLGSDLKVIDAVTGIRSASSSPVRSESGANPDHSRDPLSRVSSDRSSHIRGWRSIDLVPGAFDRASSRRIGRDVARRRISGREGSTSGSRARIGIAQVMSSIRR